MTHVYAVQRRVASAGQGSESWETVIILAHPHDATHRRDVENEASVARNTYRAVEFKVWESNDADYNSGYGDPDIWNEANMRVLL